jgi:hypothetical protein
MRETLFLAGTLGFIWLSLVGAGCGDSFAAEGEGGIGGTPTAGSGGNVGGGTAGTGGGVATGEDCMNEIDDDDDDLVDCDDPDCDAGFVCVPPLPDGWLGVGWLQPSTDTPCPDLLPVVRDVYVAEQLQVPATSCECTCAPPSPSAISCVATTTCYSDTSCTLANNLQSQDVPMSCVPIDLDAGAGGGGSCRANNPVAVSGAAQCTPSTPTVPAPINWQPAARACLQSDPGLCSGPARACVPRLPGHELGPCVYHGGDVDCPAGFSDKRPVHNDHVDDSRTCGDCTCEDPVGATCGCPSGSCYVEVHGGQSDCTSASFDVVAPTACVTLTHGSSNLNHAELVGATVTSPGSCVAKSPSFTGEAVPDQPVTVCCVAAEG